MRHLSQDINGIFKFCEMVKPGGYYLNGIHVILCTVTILAIAINCH